VGLRESLREHWTHCGAVMYWKHIEGRKEGFCGTNGTATLVLLLDGQRSRGFFFSSASKSKKSELGPYSTYSPIAFETVELICKWKSSLEPKSPKNSMGN